MKYSSLECWWWWWWCKKFTNFRENSMANGTRFCVKKCHQLIIFFVKIPKSVKIITLLGQISHFESSFPSHPLPHCWLGSLSRWLRGGHWGGAAGMWSGRPRGAPPPSRSTCRPRCNLQFHLARGKRLIIVLQDKDEALPTGWMKKATVPVNIKWRSWTNDRFGLI